MPLPDQKKDRIIVNDGQKKLLFTALMTSRVLFEVQPENFDDGKDLEGAQRRLRGGSRPTVST